MRRKTAQWPYPVVYNKFNQIETEVLVPGGGIAGSWAALSVAKRGAEVTIVDEMDVFAAGPSGCDHIVYAIDNPCCPLTAEEFIALTGPW